MKYVIRSPVEINVFLGGQIQAGSVYACLKLWLLWINEPFRVKVRSILKRSWQPQEAAIKNATDQCLTNELFGTPEDFGDRLLALQIWHHSRQWDFSALLPEDEKKAQALDVFTILTNMRFRGVYSEPSLNLELGKHAPFPICMLIYPTIIKIPIISLRFFLQIHAKFAFNAIRRSQHPHSTAIIAYLYELLFLQQKTAIALREYLEFVAYTSQHKKGSLLINAEVNAVMTADLIFSYLKASIEKTIALVGAIHGITNLDSQKTHQAKFKALEKGLPERIKQSFYCQFFMTFVASENIDELNNYRSGILHKKGIADLQPHNYAYVNGPSIPLHKILYVLKDQHAKNTALLLATLALLTDELARREPPDISLTDIPVPGFNADMSTGTIIS